jgi:hypothetical protein
VARAAPIVFYAAGAGLILFALVTSGADRRRDRSSTAGLRVPGEAPGRSVNVPAAIAVAGVVFVAIGGVLHSAL